ncbi:MAG TPA: MBL fold metallo-hydrolase [Thermoanaerobaculia bacterium]|nr:MBL fold metallo-hydrolase [Thermoanaerobaculia bacterium]
MSDPSLIKIRSYQVGFGDCFLLSIIYRDGSNRHILIDFGTTAMPRFSRHSLLEIAKDIREVTCGKLHAVVATHRHADHISGFAGKSGKIIADLKPDIVIQPWTEDPEAQPEAAAFLPSASTKRFLAGLNQIPALASHVLREIENLEVTGTVRNQLQFLGMENLKNTPAVKSLTNMSADHRYLHYGQPSGLEGVLPGVRVRVLGPPTLQQLPDIERQRAEDEAEFWHLQAFGASFSSKPLKRLFRKADCADMDMLPFEVRWFLPRLEAVRGDQLLEIVRILDRSLNNTSLILLFEVGSKKLLFPGDAQIENWSYALKSAPDHEEVCELLSQVDVYKVGHHGSLNATPKSLWKLFAKKGTAGKPGRLRTIMSTMAGQHGSTYRQTEVPRRTLVEELKSHSEHFSTQHLRGKTFFKDFEIPV